MSNEASGNGREPWHLRRQVPVTLFLAIAIQSAVAIWWAAEMDTRVDYLESHFTTTQTFSERLTKIEVSQEVIKKDVSEIEDLLRQMFYRASPLTNSED